MLVFRNDLFYILLEEFIMDDDTTFLHEPLIAGVRM